MFENAKYIKAQEYPSEFSFYDPAPFFRKEFTLKDISEAHIFVQSPGFARYYINGKDITKDLFISAVSDYTKILWYNEYDVTHLLRKGKNVICVIAGNGYLNESFRTAWDFDTAPWRDAPQFILNLCVDGKSVVVSDKSWKCSQKKSHIIFNHLRSGEYWDMRKKDDAQASMEQTLINFDIVPLLEKWYGDILASMFDDNSLHGTVPSPDWSLGHTCGPVCDCLLYELPYKVYLYTGRSDLLLAGIAHFERYIEFLEKKVAEGHEFSLGDWMSNARKNAVPKQTVTDIHLLKAYDITSFAHRIAKTELCPSFITELGYVKGSIQTVRGKIDAEWQTESGGFKYTVTLTENISATFRGRTLKKGINKFFVSQEKIL